MTYLHAAIRAGNLQLIQDLISGKKMHLRQPFHYLFGGFNIINTKNFAGDTPLLLTLKKYSQNPDLYQQILDMLLNAKANTEIADQKGDSPLNVAVTTGLIKAVQSLINFNANVHPNGQALSPLACAAANGHTEIAELLLTNGVNLSIKSNINSSGHLMTPLQAAAANGQVKMVEFLLQQNVDINEITFWELWISRTALWFAVDYAQKNHDNSLVKLLLLKGADPNIGKSPFANGLAKMMVLDIPKRNYVDSVIESLTDEEREQLNISNGTECFVRQNENDRTDDSAVRYKPKFVIAKRTAPNMI